MYRIETTCGWVRHIRSCLKPKMPKAQRYQMRSFWKMRSRDAVTTTACLNGCWDRWEVAKTGPQLPTKPEILLIFIWVCVNTYRYIFSGMNIHLPAILGFTRYQGFDPSPFAKYVIPFLGTQLRDSSPSEAVVWLQKMTRYWGYPKQTRGQSLRFLRITFQHDTLSDSRPFQRYNAHSAHFGANLRWVTFGYSLRCPSSLSRILEIPNKISFVMSPICLVLQWFGWMTRFQNCWRLKFAGNLYIWGPGGKDLWF